MADITMGNGPFIDGLPIKNGDFPWRTVHLKLREGLGAVLEDSIKSCRRTCRYTWWFNPLPKSVSSP